TFTRTAGLNVPGSLPVALAAGDLDDDGLSDLVVAAAGSNEVVVYRQTAAGSFVPLGGPPISVGVSPSSVPLADLDGDGRLDIVVANQFSGDVSVLLNEADHPFATATRFRAGPGIFGLDDFLGQSVVRSQLGTAAVIAGRFDGDSVPDLIAVHSGIDGFT